MELGDEKKQLIQFCFGKNILVNPSFISKLSKEDIKNIYNIISQNQDIKVLDEGIYEQEKQSEITKNVKVLFSYKEDSKKRSEQDFISYFNLRYKAIEKILKNRPDLQNTISINRVASKREKDSVALIGMVTNKQTTKNNNLILTLEDNTGKINVLFSNNKKGLFELANDLVEDEVIGVIGVGGNNIVFANNLLWPDVPFDNLFKKSDEDGYVIFLSDLHVGSNNFLEGQFKQFLEWINGNVGNKEQIETANKVKYIFIIGDLIDGCGIYPEQDSELVIKDIYEQYKKCAELLAKIPSNIPLIICPGNHDAMRIAEPQPELYKDFAKPLWDLPNTILVSNPALINIDSKENFSGFNMLLYHGYSFDYYTNNVESIRTKGGYDRPDLIMKFLLQRRHLAPTHTSTLHIPDSSKDPLVIDTVPDFFITGHIHKASTTNYKNITLICGSCWQSKTSFQEKVGHHPEPARVPIVNLKTRKMKMLRF